MDADRGTLVHSVLEALFDADSLDRTLEHALNLVPDIWKSQVEKKPELANLIPEYKEWFDRVSALLTTYFALEKPSTFDPTSRELHLELDIGENIYLHGFVDRLDVAPTGEVRIVDYKTGKSPKAPWQEKALFQLRVYALIYWKTRGILPKKLQLIYLGDGNLLVSQPTQSQLEKTEKVLLETATQIFEATSSAFWPTRKSRLCDWCHFKPICPAHQI